MSNKKQMIIGKFVKKDYNDELETVLEHKQFSENDKNVLLNILYKIENSYKDYESVKINVETVDEFIKNIIKIIKEDCEKITLIKPTEEKSDILKNKKFIVDRDNKEIICYPVEREILYCIAKIGAKPKIIKDKHFLIDETLSNVINVGKCVNTVEAIRDFNGFSWTTIKSEIEEGIECNIIYQNLLILVGYKFLNKWVRNKEFIIDYYELLKINLSEKYGEKRADRIVKLISELSILIERKYNRRFLMELEPVEEDIKRKIAETQNMEEFVEKITNQKKELADKIGEMDEILNDKKKMRKEFAKRNNELPIEKKIFNIQILRNNIAKERGAYFEQIDKLNDLLNPKKFTKYKKELIDNEKVVEFAYCQDFYKKIEELLIELQEVFLECFKIKINNAETKNEIINLFYEFRYYGKIPFSNDKNINKILKLQKSIEEIQELLIKKAYTSKIMNIFTNSAKLKNKIIKNIFITRVINLTDLYIELTKEEGKLYMNLYDEEMLDNKFEIDTTEIANLDKIRMKLNKKIKVFI